MDLAIARAVKRKSLVEMPSKRPNEHEINRNKWDSSSLEQYKQLIVSGGIVINDERYFFKEYDFFDGRLTIPLPQNRFIFLPLMSKKYIQKYHTMVLYNREGCFFRLKLIPEGLKYKSLVFLRIQIQEYYKRIKVPIQWLKLSRAGNVNYAVYRVLNGEKSDVILKFIVNTKDKQVFDGSFLCPGEISDPWQEIYEASLHLLEIE